MLVMNEVVLILDRSKHISPFIGLAVWLAVKLKLGSTTRSGVDSFNSLLTVRYCISGVSAVAMEVLDVS
jgi:hypothetical protein